MWALIKKELRSLPQTWINVRRREIETFRSIGKVLTTNGFDIGRTQHAKRLTLSIDGRKHSVAEKNLRCYHRV